MSIATPRTDAAVGGRKAPDYERERKLFIRWRRFGDRRARDELVLRFLPLARDLAWRFHARAGRCGSRDDLVQVASCGLVVAIDRFDPDRGCRFPTFAVPTIVGELKRHARDFGWAVRVPRGMQERVLQVNAATDQLATVLGRAPSPAEVAERCGLTVDEVLEALEARAAKIASSVAPPASDEDDDLEDLDPITDPETEGLDGGYELVESRDAVERALARCCSERDRLILRLRFDEDLKQSEIARVIGVSQMQVSRLLSDLLERLRDECESPSADRGNAAAIEAEIEPACL